MKKVVFEAALIAIVGAAVGLTANALSPLGINLKQDFFHTKDRPQPAPLLVSANSAATLNTTSTAPAIVGNDLAATLKQEGLGLADGKRALELFNDPRRPQNQIVFIDARHDKEYNEGHIPGAYQFDYYYKEKFLGTIIPLVQAAELIVVYCNGGDCTDSHYAALDLSNFVPREKLIVYSGGITEWKARGQEVETGERNSGVLQKPK